MMRLLVVYCNRFSGLCRRRRSFRSVAGTTA